MADYPDGNLKVTSGTLAQTDCPTTGAWTAFYTVGGGSNNNGLNTPARRGARNIIIDIVNADTSSRLIQVALSPSGEAFESAHLAYRAYVPAAGMSSLFIPGMKLGGVLRYYVDIANTIRLIVGGEELQ